jgi:outer membrane protein assembly factor BamB
MNAINNRPPRKLQHVKFSLLASCLFLSACGVGDYLGGKKEAPPLPGERIAVLDFEKDLRPETDGKNTAASFMNDSARTNDGWTQAGGDPGHAMYNLAFTQKQPQRVWQVSIGEGSRKNLPLTAQPIVAGETIFALDTDAMLSAFSIKDGKKRWSVSVRDAAEEDSVISGGISYANGMIFATAGYHEIVALDAQKGEIKWRAKLPSPSRAAPTSVNGRVYVTTMNNTVLAMDAANGAVLWEYAGLGQSTALIGAASPAVTSDMVVPAFSSGEIYALRAGNGSVAWSDNLASALRLGGMTTLSDIRGLPVVGDNVVYAISYGGKTAAIDIQTGARLWSRDIAGSKTPWVSGNRLFLISADAQIVSLDKETGAVMWISQLARFEDKEKREGPIIWTGPMMAGGRLLAFSTDGRVAEINPADGTLVREWDSGETVSIAPILVGGTLYILGDDGDLSAYR